VPSRDGDEIPVVELLREMFFIMFIVGFAKSFCSTCSAAAVFLEEPSLLFWVGVVDALCEGDAAPSGSALPVAGIKAVVTVPHQGNARREGIDMVETREHMRLTMVIAIRAWTKELNHDVARLQTSIPHATCDFRTTINTLLLYHPVIVW
jgi:hypothetical protein